MSTVGGRAARRAAHRGRCPAIAYNPTPTPNPNPNPNPNPKPKPKPKPKSNPNPNPKPEPRITQVPSGVQEISLDELTLTEGEAVGLTEAQQAGDARRYVRRCTEM